MAALKSSGRPPKHKLVGRTFGRLKVLGFEGRNGCHCIWRCWCLCGSIAYPTTNALIRGQMSCGCLRSITYSDKPFGSDFYGTREFHAWRGMVNRCYLSNHPKYPRYGARGITVCDRWRDSFLSFYEDMGPCPAEHSIDRVDNDASYEKANCRWADAKTQANNKRQTIRPLTFRGETRSITEWAALMGTTVFVLSNRLNTMNWSVERTLTTPVRRINKTRA